jgi:hypothetical protein
MLVNGWNFVDAFTVDQAAILWTGENPSSGIFDELDQLKKPNVGARKQMLSGAISLGLLQANHKTNGGSVIGDYGKSVVSRDELTRFARSKKEYPAFLFDTAAPLPTTGETLPALSDKNVGGRPPEFDWDMMLAELIRYADLHNLPKKQTELIDYLLQWFANGMGQDNAKVREYPTPGETSVKTRVSQIYKNLNKLGWKAE